MNWEQIMELRDAGMAIGSHGLHHEILTELKGDKIRVELAESKDRLEYHLKVAVDSFSVPRGFYDQKVLDLAKEAGYKRVFVSDPDAHDTAGFILGRVAVKGSWSLARFEQALRREVPYTEQIFDGLKGTVKQLLGGKNYDAVRGKLLSKGKKAR